MSKTDIFHMIKHMKLSFHEGIGVYSSNQITKTKCLEN